MMGSGTELEWFVFAAVVTILLVLDLALINRGERVSIRSALIQTLFSVAVALAFGGWIFLRDGNHERASLFLTGYLLEEALSVDNLFVFLIIFSYFKVKAKSQRRALFWGILSAIVLRGVMIVAGTELVERFHWVLYLFGAFLLYTAWGLVTSGDDDAVEPEKNRVLKLFRRFVPMSADYDGDHFFTRVSGRNLATPLLAVLAVIETTDVVFAVDSVPAVIGITTDKFLVFTSNIFAICALRSLYFALSAMMGKFRYLNVGLAAVLAFIGAKMLLEKPITSWLGHDLPVWVSLTVIAVCLGGAVIASLANPEKPREMPKINPTGEYPPAGPDQPS
jgi:tellurite resistance protein TerC